MSVLCRLEDAEKGYRSTHALGPVTLEVRGSEILGLRGPNGAGKSTLMGLLAGAMRPDKGTVYFAPGVRNLTGYVPQELSLYGSLSVNENLRFWGLASGLPSRAASARGRWLLEQLELTEKAREPVDALSGGMKRRVHLASALMVTPKLLLLDEPTVGADPDSAGLIFSMLTHLRDRGCGVVLISHQAGELERVCGRILTLEKGLFVSEEGQA